MVVDAAYILATSRGKYTVGANTYDAITSTTLQLMLTWAIDKIANDGGDTVFSTVQYEQAQALLVCHYCELDSSDKTGESMTGYSYSRERGGTPWLKEYQGLLAGALARARKSRRAASAGVTRNDADLGDLKFDRTEISIGESDT